MKHLAAVLLLILNVTASCLGLLVVKESAAAGILKHSNSIKKTAWDDVVEPYYTNPSNVPNFTTYFGYTQEDFFSFNPAVGTKKRTDRRTNISEVSDATFLLCY